ncbi:hypothetical protein BEP19_06535 [Ammoniphilus oxalaticus]|uniref:DUF1885 domain-containing protein n=1 Tax=Ammoniphilus oxalaticus TaxID=66863 RepID=A0A419SJ60_9BACL|nr:hypothetical protein BEP19_06535 [Ammoniphilus oxalaticus]
MSKSAYIKLVEASTVQEITLDDVKSKLDHYIEMTKKTGQQLAWSYGDVSFPYTLIEKEEGKGRWFYLKGNDPKLYKYIMFGVGTEEIETDGETKQQHYIQIALPDDSTHGDVGKANEFCKFLAKEFKGELHLFNQRIMYFYPRK